jgi:hypothetical protein
VALATNPRITDVHRRRAGIGGDGFPACPWHLRAGPDDGHRFRRNSRGAQARPTTVSQPSMEKGRIAGRMLHSPRGPGYRSSRCCPPNSSAGAPRVRGLISAQRAAFGGQHRQRRGHVGQVSTRNWAAVSPGPTLTDTSPSRIRRNAFSSVTSSPKRLRQKHFRGHGESRSHPPCPS